MDPSSPPPAYSELDKPPIPPRKPVNSSVPATYQVPPCTASASTSSPGPYMPTASSGPWLGPDPRSSSTQSLLPETSRDSQSTSSGDYLGRRKLLIIYIHGFLGNDQSFRSFPAHVHALLANLLADSHVIHSKIYPRYKTYRSVDVARDNFSEWLRPHESPNTDVVLIGHSMGGILAADVVLMPNPSPYGTNPFKHRIVGHVSLDCPFIGLHPGIVVSGISSLFKPAPTPPQDDNQESASSTAPYSPGPSSFADPSVSSLYLTNTQSTDPGSSTNPPSIASSSQPQHDPFLNQPFFNQPFFNDSGLQERPFVQRMFHFANKYRSEGLIQAAAKHIFSYLEFGSCLADPTGLESRYRKIRALEDVDELQTGEVNQGSVRPLARVRFVNYYTLCTGRPKSPKASPNVGSPQLGTDNTTSPKTSFDLSNDSASSSSVELDFAPNKIHAEKQSQLYARNESPLPSITLEHRDTMGNSKDHKTLLDADAKTVDARTSDTTIKNSSASDDNRLSMHSIDPTPIDEDATSHPPQDTAPTTSQDETVVSSKDTSNPSPGKEDTDLPPLPDPPTTPDIPDPSLYTDKDERKQVEREAKRIRRAHENALKDHAKAVREREKLVEKRKKRAQKEAEKALKEAARQEKEAMKESQRKEKEAQREQQRLDKEASEREKEAQKEKEHEDTQQTKEAEDQSRSEAEAEAEAEAAVVAEVRGLKSSKPRKLRKFCNLPTKGGRIEDPTWVDIYIADVDEVGAHCGLFFSGQHYEKLVGDVGNRIMGWVQDDMTKRAIQEMNRPGAFK